MQVPRDQTPTPPRVKTGDRPNVGGLVCETLSVKRSKLPDINCDHQQISSWKKKSLARAETMCLEPLTLNSI